MNVENMCNEIDNKKVALYLQILFIYFSYSHMLTALENSVGGS